MFWEVFLALTCTLAPAGLHSPSQAHTKSERKNTLVVPHRARLGGLVAALPASRLSPGTDTAPFAPARGHSLAWTCRSHPATSALR